MKTFTLWLLISIGQTGSGGQTTHAVERFAAQQECERVKAAIVAAYYTQWGKPNLVCIGAEVARP